MAESKWEGKATAKVINGTAEKIWPFFEQDFCSFHKWSPGLQSCYKVEGEDGKPGLTRYCAFAPLDGDQTAEVKFTHEKLLWMDPIQKSFSYEITENNVGFKGYVAIWKIKDIENDGCEIEWAFAADPIEGWKYEDFSGFVQMGLAGLAEKINKALEATT